MKSLSGGGGGATGITLGVESSKAGAERLLPCAGGGLSNICRCHPSLLGDKGGLDVCNEDVRTSHNRDGLDNDEKGSSEEEMDLGDGSANNV